MSDTTAVEPTETAPPAASEDVAAPTKVSRETRAPRVSSADSSHLEQEGDIAADYLEGLLDIADLDGDIDMDVDGDRAMVSIVGGDLEDLVGDRGQVLDALQELTRLAVTRETGDRSRLMLDIAGFRAARREALTALGTEAATRAQSTAEPVRLEPMTPFERKIVHDAVAAAGLTSESEGVEPRRFVVVLPHA
jgi:spoIIIJ-associated protein